MRLLRRSAATSRVPRRASQESEGRWQPSILERDCNAERICAARRQLALRNPAVVNLTSAGLRASHRTRARTQLSAGTKQDLPVHAHGEPNGHCVRLSNVARSLTAILLSRASYDRRFTFVVEHRRNRTSWT